MNELEDGELDTVGVEAFPRTLGRYALLRPLASGGMGELFLATTGEETLRRLCVVKMPSSTPGDSDSRGMFEDEARLALRLNHPNLVHTFDAGTVGTHPYLAMELVEGKDLKAILKRCLDTHARIPVPISLYVCAELCRALTYLHSESRLSVTHRDVCPANVLLSYHGAVKLTDVGLATSVLHRKREEPRRLLGHVGYVSPEQARGLPADHRSDVYAVSALLWELLTGQALLRVGTRNHTDVYSALRNPKVVPPSTIMPDIRPELDDVVLRGLAVEPAERYQTAVALKHALLHVLAVNHPDNDADITSAFVQNLFPRERKTERREYDRYLRVAPAQLVSIAPRFDARPQEIQDAPARSLHTSAYRRLGMVIAGRYRLDSVIGIGGMGVVYKATHLMLDRAFGLKMLHEAYCDHPGLVRRFIREARAATRVTHPNIVEVFDSGTTSSGDLYFVMELLNGEPLDAIIDRGGPMSIERVIHVSRQLCSALEAAHETGIVHRDLKPSNIVLMDRFGATDFVKVLDFGICKPVDVDSHPTTPGLAIGSPDYMAPEQLDGIDTGTATDIYALGCVIFEMLSGRLPYSGRSAAETLAEKANQDAPDVASIRPEVPRLLADVVARCINRHSALRPLSMRSVEQDLELALHSLPRGENVVPLDVLRDRPPRVREESMVTPILIPWPPDEIPMSRSGTSGASESGKPGGR